MHHVQNWSGMTSDPWILEAVIGYHLELVVTPTQSHQPVTVVSKDHEPLIEEEVVKLQQKGAIMPVPAASKCEGFYSTLFLVPKKEAGQMRSVVNLRPLNRFLPHIHFKM